MARQSCGQCQYWTQVVKEPTKGQCRRMPPQVVVIQMKQQKPAMGSGGKILQVEQVVNQIQPMFPPMMAEDFGCGMFEKKEEWRDGG